MNLADGARHHAGARDQFAQDLGRDAPAVDRAVPWRIVLMTLLGWSSRWRWWRWCCRHSMASGRAGWRSVT